MSSYFRQVPNFEYVSRDVDQRQISEYAPVKNLFRRGKLREDIFGNLSFFTKYSIIGDERPDNVAFKFYGDENLDWVVLISNNILNIQTEWPLTQQVFDDLLIEKYGSIENLNSIKYYKTIEIKDSLNITVLPKDIIVQPTLKSGNGFIAGEKRSISQSMYFDDTFQIQIASGGITSDIKIGDTIQVTGYDNSLLNGNYVINNLFKSETGSVNIIEVTLNSLIESDANMISQQLNGSEKIEFISSRASGNQNTLYYEYYDSNLRTIKRISSVDFLIPVTNLDYETNIENNKRNIFVLKPRYLNIVFNDLEEIMKYKKGSSQYVSRTLKKGDNIRLYQ